MNLELGGVLTLRTEKVKKKIPYWEFKDKLTKLVITNMDGVKYLQTEELHLKDLFKEL